MNAKEIMKKIIDNGYDCYYIGGMVRNKLMGLDITDTDIVTSATPEQLKEIFTDCCSCGNNFLVTLIDNIEVATYRKDKDECAEVIYSLKEDVMRRDFTINGIAMDINGNICDYVGGKSDIENKILRCIGDPIRRFKEDPVRIIRGLRFASIYGLTIEENTSEGMHYCRHLLNNVPKERFLKELEKVFVTNKAYDFLKLLLKYDILFYYFPSLKGLVLDGGKYHNETVIEHSLLAVKMLDGINVNTLKMKLSALYHDVGKQKYFIKDGVYHFYNHNINGVPYIEKDLSGLKCTNDVIEFVKTLAIRHMDSIWANDVYDSSKELSKKAIRKLAVRLYNSNVDVFDWLLLKYADRKANVRKSEYTTLDYYDQMYSDILKILNEEHTFCISDLSLSGHDIMEICNIKPGPKVGYYLKLLFDNVIDEVVENDKEKLTQFLINILETESMYEK